MLVKEDGGAGMLMEQLGAAGMHQLPLECLGCSWSPGIHCSVLI